MTTKTCLQSILKMEYPLAKNTNFMSRIMRKTVYGVSNQPRHKQSYDGQSNGPNSIWHVRFVNAAYSLGQKKK